MAILKIKDWQGNVTEINSLKGSGIPIVTSADNGKILKVVNGAWAAANDSGSANNQELNNLPTVSDVSKSIGYMFSCLKSGQFKCGTKTWTQAFTTTEELALSTGLNEIHGIIINAVDKDLITEIDNTQCARFIMIFKNQDGTLSAVSVNSKITTNAMASYLASGTQGNVYPQPFNGGVRFNGGNMYCVGRYNSNDNFQMVIVNQEYEWLAW